MPDCHCPAVVAYLPILAGYFELTPSPRPEIGQAAVFDLAALLTALRSAQLGLTARS